MLIWRISALTAMQQALALHQAGSLAEAEAIYRQVLAEDPDQPDALHYLGLIAHQVGRHDVAADLIRRAISQKPDNARSHTNLGNALWGQGDFAAAESAYRRAI